MADAYPSHVLPAAGSPDAALTRARINFFVDTWFSKAGSYFYKILMSGSEDEKAKLSQEFVDVVGKEIEPLLKDAKPFFGGSQKVTLAEVHCGVILTTSEADILQALTAPFIIRTYAMAKNELLPKSITSGLDALPNFSKWAAEVVKQDSVTYIWDEEAVIDGTRKRIESQKAASK